MTERHNHEQSMSSAPVPGDGKALSERAKHLVHLITGTHRGNIDTHRELYALIDSMAVAIDSPPLTPEPSTPKGEPHWPMLRDGHLRAICFAYEKGYAAGLEERNTSNVFGDSGSQAAAFDVGLQEGRAAQSRVKRAPSAPEGWQLVPCRMTDAMLRAAGVAWLDDPMRRTTTMWGAALAAAPKPEAQDTDPDTGPKPGDVLAWGSQAVLDVAAERRRQIEAEGWTPEHDDEHVAGEMALAASCYAEEGPPPYEAGWQTIPTRWPWSPDWWKPQGYRRNLVKAGALILAEIERLDRAAPKPEGE